MYTSRVIPAKTTVTHTPGRIVTYAANPLRASSLRNSAYYPSRRRRYDYDYDEDLGRKSYLRSSKYLNSDLYDYDYLSRYDNRRLSRKYDRRRGDGGYKSYASGKKGYKPYRKGRRSYRNIDYADLD